MGAIYTIGYGNRSAEEFINLLKRYQIAYLIDIRSQPYSKFSPDFSQNQLRDILQKNKIRYVFMGDTLGGRPNDPDCYDEHGNVDYEKYKTKAFYQDGIARLKNAYGQSANIVLMCSELKPEQCHRSKLVGKTLDEIPVPVQHIDETGQLRSQELVYKAVEANITRVHESQLGLFGPDSGIDLKLKSRKSYAPQLAARDDEDDS